MTNIQEEIWKYIPGYEGLYKISCTTLTIIGNPRSDARFKKHRIEHFVRPSYPLKDGKPWYPLIHFRGRDGLFHTYFMHIIVASMFVPNPENKPQVNHKNGIKTDFSISNLEWCTPSENTAHAFKNNLRIPKKGSGKPLAKLRESDVILIKERLKSGDYHKDIARDYGVQRTLISGINQGKRWKHVI